MYVRKLSSPQYGKLPVVTVCGQWCTLATNACTPAAVDASAGAYPPPPKAFLVEVTKTPKLVNYHPCSEVGEVGFQQAASLLWHSPPAAPAQAARKAAVSVAKVAGVSAVAAAKTAGANVLSKRRYARSESSAHLQYSIYSTRHARVPTQVP
jgi:hypothetical protein